jgi:membrane-associated phospholipid phosphatase
VTVKRWWPAPALIIVTLALAVPAVRRLDIAVRNLADARRPPWAYDIAVNVNRLGSGAALTAIAAGLATWAAFRHRSWRPVALVVAAFGLVVALTEPLKWLLERPAPHAVLSTGVSYPSGHVVNAVVWYAVICTLLALPPTVTTAIRWAAPAIVSITNVYLGFHWVTDMVAGILLGLLIQQLLQTRSTSTPAALKEASSASVASSSVTRV